MPVDPSPPRVTGIILAGGMGLRFGGQDKGLIELNGHPLVQHAINSLAAHTDQIIISANRNFERYQQFGYPVISDNSATSLGPLAGLAAALPAVKTEFALLIPCDTPFLPHELCPRLLAAIIESNSDIAISDDGNRLQPMCSLLRSTLLPRLNQALSKGHLKALRWMQQQNHCVVDFSDTSQGFININTPDELRDAESLVDRETH